MNIISCPLSFLISDLNFLKTLKTSNFSFNKYTQTYLKNYYEDKKVFIDWARHIYWISSNNLLGLEVDSLGEKISKLFSKQTHFTKLVR